MGDRNFSPGNKIHDSARQGRGATYVFVCVFFLNNFWCLDLFFIDMRIFTNPKVFFLGRRS